MAIVKVSLGLTLELDLSRFILRIVVWISFMARVFPRFGFRLGKELGLLLLQVYG
jgi:hypothetical protein